MSIENELMEKASIVVSFIRENISLDLKTASNKNMITVEEKELMKICNLIEASVTNSFVKSSNEFISFAKKVQKK